MRDSIVLLLFAFILVSCTCNTRYQSEHKQDIAIRSFTPDSLQAETDTISLVFKFTEPFNKALQFSDKARTAIIKSVKNNPQTSEKLFQEIGTITNRTKGKIISRTRNDY